MPGVITRVGISLNLSTTWNLDSLDSFGMFLHLPSFFKLFRWSLEAFSAFCGDFWLRNRKSERDDGSNAIYNISPRNSRKLDNWRLQRLNYSGRAWTTFEFHINLWIYNLLNWYSSSCDKLSILALQVLLARLIATPLCHLFSLIYANLREIKPLRWIADKELLLELEGAHVNFCW